MKPPTRRDDYESVFYIMLYLLLGEELPWAKELSYVNNKGRAPKALERYLNYRATEKCVKETIEKLPGAFRPLYEVALRVKRLKEPPYATLKSALKNKIVQGNFDDFEGIKVANKND